MGGSKFGEKLNYTGIFSIKNEGDFIVNDGLKGLINAIRMFIYLKSLI